MADFKAARANMVDSQVRPNGVTDHRILAAMAAVPREDFVPGDRRDIAYVDDDLGIAKGRYLIEPMVFARLLQLAELRSTDRILHVGSASGYGTAIMAGFAAKVVALECDATLAAMARANLAGREGIMVVEGPLAEGFPAEAPYDVILIEGRVGEVPEALFAQLADIGRLVTVIGENAAAKASLWTVNGKTRAVRGVFDAAIPSLPGFAKRKAAFTF